MYLCFSELRHKYLESMLVFIVGAVFIVGVVFIVSTFSNLAVTFEILFRDEDSYNLYELTFWSNWIHWEKVMGTYL